MFDNNKENSVKKPFLLLTGTIGN